MHQSMFKALICAGVVTFLPGCQPPSGDTAPTQATGQNEHASSSASGSTRTGTGADTPYPDDLQRMLDISASYEDPDQPCLYRERPPPPGADTIPKSRWREIQSDSYWLGRWAKDNLRDRLAYAVVTGSQKNGKVVPIYEIAVTGDAPILPPPLRDRAKDVPVRVVYDYPVSFDEFMARREQATDAVAKLVPNWNGAGGLPGPHGRGFVRLDVFVDEAMPKAEVLAQCDALRRSYRLPVLMEFSEGRMQVGP